MGMRMAKPTDTPLPATRTLMKLLSAVLLSVASATAYAVDGLQIDTQLNVDGELKPVETYYIENGGTASFKPEDWQEYDALVTYRCERRWYRLWMEKCEDVARPRGRNALGLEGTISALQADAGRFIVKVDGKYFTSDGTSIVDDGHTNMELSNRSFTSLAGSLPLNEGEPFSFTSADGKVVLTVIVKNH